MQKQVEDIQSFRYESYWQGDAKRRIPCFFVKTIQIEREWIVNNHKKLKNKNVLVDKLHN